MHAPINPSERILKVASRWSFAVSITVLGIKTFAFSITKSQAVLSDALESIVNVVASLLALWVIHEALAPADDEHPYGHGKLEYFSAAFEGGLVCFASLMIAGEAIQALWKGVTLNNLDTGIYLVSFASLLNLVLGLSLLKVAKKHNSDALKSSGLHVLSDLWTTLGAIVGILLVMWTGQVWIDAATAIIMAFLLLWAGYKIVRRALGALLDEHDMTTLEELAKVFNKNQRQGLIDLHNLKVIRSGRFHHVDAHLVIPEFWDIDTAHKFSNLLEYDIVNDYPFDGEIAFHLDPCGKNYCDHCDMKNCPIRKTEFKNKFEFTAKDLISGAKFTEEGSWKAGI